jgi:anaerobic selenocysteine-containing dehydrogenase
VSNSHYIAQENGVFPSVCSLDCPDTCGLLIHKKNGKISKVEGNPAHPVTQGAICNKVRHMPERLYDPQRLTTPMKRTGPKGEGKFAPISWDEAIQTISHKWERLIDVYGSESILPYSFAGNMGRLNMTAMGHRFFHRLGASQLERTICNAAGNTGFAYTMGGSYGTDPMETIHAKLHIFWGCNAVSTNMHQVILSEKARKNGAQIVVIDVHQNQTARWGDWFIPILPGTDAALALGIMHILFAENLVDASFLGKYTVGFEELEEHVKSYDPQSVSDITQVPVADIYRLARLYATTSPSFIRIGNGPQHHDNGGMFVRTVSCLPALTGQWLAKGGGAIRENGGFSALDSRALTRPDLLPTPTRTINMNQIGEALTTLEDNPIFSVFVYNSNPVVVAPDANLVKQGFAREDLFTVVHDLFLTETARYADIVLPATSSFENLDLYTSYWHHYVHLQQPVIKPYEESKSNLEVFRLLAQAMGFDDLAFQDSEQQMINDGLDNPDNPYLEGITYEKLAEHHFIKINRDKEPLVTGTLRTPSGKIELYSEQMEQAGYPPLPTYLPIQETEAFPLLFISGPNHNFLNSTFSNNTKHASMEKGPYVHMHPEEASKRGIVHQEKVRIYNKRGECELTAWVSESVLPGVTVTQGLWADNEGTKQLVNVLTSSRLSDMGRGATFFSTRVEVEKI